MRLSFVQSYPIFHEGLGLEEWLRVRNRDRFLPAVAAALGHEVELLAVGRDRASLESHGPGMEGYRIEIFPTDRPGARPRAHASRALVEHARQRAAAVHFIKGIDGAAGLSLVRDHLLPSGLPYAMVVGGKSYNREAARAGVVLCETAGQRERLLRPGLRLWRRPLEASRLLLLPKSVDTEVFRPAAPGDEKRWDVILAGRLLGWKNFDAVAPLAAACRVAVVGGGPEESRLRRRFPAVTWLGRRPHAEVASLLRQARILYHPGRFDAYPRVVAEAFACGLAVVAVRGGVSPDAIPPTAGLVAPAAGAPERILALLADRPRLEAMGQAARAHAVRELGQDSCRPALLAALERLTGGCRS